MVIPALDFVPLIDLSAWYSGDPEARAELVRAVDEALAASGFLLVTAHRVDDVLRRQLRAAVHEFFALPVEIKEQYATGPTGRGWVPVGREANAYSSGEESPPDLKQTFSCSNDRVPDGLESDSDLFPPNQWPTEAPNLQALAWAWRAEMLRLAGDLADLFSAALGLEPMWMRSRTDDPMWTLAMNWYPPVSVVGDPQPGQFRIGPHTDFGVMTLLDREPGIGGLQVQRADGSWVDAPYVDGALTINVGDLLARWTGDRWRSARHRVLPPPGDGVEESLLSLVFFDEGNMNQMIETLPAPAAGPNVYEPIRAADYLRLKLEQIDV